MGSLSRDDLLTLWRELAEGRSHVQETVDKLRMSEAECGTLARQKGQLEARLATIGTGYEELLGTQFLRDCLRILAKEVCREDHSRRREK